MLKRRRTASVGLLALLLLVAVPQSGVPFGAAAPVETYAPRTLYDLQSVEELRALFNEEKGMPRLVLLLSPT